MLLTGYRLEIFKSKCDSKAIGIHCFAHLNDDISDVLPFLNTVLGAFFYISSPPSLTLKNYGKLITLESRKIAVNALKDEEEAGKIIAWLQREINEVWEKRDGIVPSRECERRPVLLEVLKLLPKTNCQDCGEKTCMVFAARVVEGSFSQEDCPSIDNGNKVLLEKYLSDYQFG